MQVGDPCQSKEKTKEGGMHMSHRLVREYEGHTTKWPCPKCMHPTLHATLWPKAEDRTWLSYFFLLHFPGSEKLFSNHVHHKTCSRAQTKPAVQYICRPSIFTPHPDRETSQQLFMNPSPLSADTPLPPQDLPLPRDNRYKKEIRER